MHRKKVQEGSKNADTEFEIEEAEVFMSLVVPAFNEEERLGIMLKEATEYLQKEYGDLTPRSLPNGNRTKRRDASHFNGYVSSNKTKRHGWEVLVVSDGSTDKTVDTALAFAKGLRGDLTSGIRVIHLHENRGKGGAVTHGMRHVRGHYAIFADADGASKFEDLGKLVRESERIEDAEGRAVAVGSRAHLVGSEVVVKVRSADHEGPHLLICQLAFFSAQSSHAFFSFTPPHLDASSHSSNSRYTVRL